MLSGEGLRALILVLGVADGGQDALGLESLFIQVQLFQDILDDPFRIVGVVDGEVLVEADAVNVPPQDADAGGVKGRGPDVVGHGAQSGRQTVLQFPCRLVGEGDGDDLPGPGHIHGAEPVGPVDLKALRMLRKVLQELQVLRSRPFGDEAGVAAPAVGQQVVDPLDQDGGLAGAGACQQQQRSLGGHGSLALHGIQPPQIRRDDGFPGGDVSFIEVSHMFTSFL